MAAIPNSLKHKNRKLNRKLYSELLRISGEKLNEKEDICLVGLGMNDSLSQLTGEARHILNKSRKIFYISVFPFKTKNPNKINLLDEYKKFDSSERLHGHISDIIIDEAKKSPGVCYAPYGHPIFLDNIAGLILAKAKKAGLKTKIITGISSFDVLLAGLKMDIAPNGMHLYNANELLLYKQRLDNSVPTFIFSIGSIGTVFYTRDKENKEKRFDCIKDYLKKYYNGKHEVYLLLYFDTGIEKIKTTIDNLPKKHREIIDGTTLFIPAEKKKEIDRECQKTFNDPNTIKNLIE